MSVNDLDKFLDLDEQESVGEETTNFFGLSIPKRIQTYDVEKGFWEGTLWASPNKITSHPI